MAWGQIPISASTTNKFQVGILVDEAVVLMQTLNIPPTLRSMEAVNESDKTILRNKIKNKKRYKVLHQ